jgi:hypothetical protein
MLCVQPRLMLATLLLMIVSSPASAFIELWIGNNSLYASDGGPLDACPASNEFCLGAPLVFADHTFSGSCIVQEFIAVDSVRVVISDCTVTKDSGAFTIAPPLVFQSTFPPLPATITSAAIDVEFVHNSPADLLELQATATTSFGFLTNLGPLTSPPTTQLSAAGPFAYGAGMTNLKGWLTFILTTPGDSITLPNSMQIGALPPTGEEVPSSSTRGLLVLGSLMGAGAMIAIWRRRVLQGA